jgi:hypothetical protein
MDWPKALIRLDPDRRLYSFPLPIRHPANSWSPAELMVDAGAGRTDVQDFGFNVNGITMLNCGKRRVWLIF